jgi:hypothetical protein
MCRVMRCCGFTHLVRTGGLHLHHGGHGQRHHRPHSHHIAVAQPVALGERRGQLQCVPRRRRATPRNQQHSGTPHFRCCRRRRCSAEAPHPRTPCGVVSRRGELQRERQLRLLIVQRVR